MATTETIINELKINVLTQEQYDAAVEAGTVNSDELYMTPSDEFYTKTEVDELIANIKTLSVYTGSETPASTLGEDGDIYLVV